MHKPVQTVNVDTNTVVRILLLITAFMVGIWLLVHLQRELVWIGVAFFLAVALDPAVTWIAQVFRAGRLLATTFVFIIFLVVLGFLVASLVPPMVSQTEALANQLPHYLQDAENSQTYLGQAVIHYHLVDRAKEVQSQMLNHITTGGDTALGVLQSVFNGVAAIITILVLTFFMLLEGPRWVTRGWNYVPDADQSHYHRVTAKMYTIVAGYMTGNIIIALLSAVLASIMMGLLNISYAIPLGLFFGLSTLVPLVGGIFAALVICVVALFTSVSSAIILLVFFTIYQSIDGHVLRPLVFGKTIEMSPLLVIISIVLGTSLAGIVGALVAIPVVACLAVVLGELTGNPVTPPKQTGRHTAKAVKA